MSPLEIGILLHYYGRCDEHEIMTLKPPILPETVKFFMDNDLLMVARHNHGASFECTDRGNAFVEHITKLDLPQMKWEIPS